MLARCLSASLQGLQAHPVIVRIDLAPGLPGIQLVGLPDKAIQESRERVRSALRNSGFRGPLVRVVINLAPADLRKEGPAFDLPIALGLLVASGQLDPPRLNGIWCAGELVLDGSLRPCRGVIAIAELAARHGAQALVVPPGNADEAALIPDLVVRTAPDLQPAATGAAAQRRTALPAGVPGPTRDAAAGACLDSGRGAGGAGPGPGGRRRSSPADGGSTRLRQDPSGPSTAFAVAATQP
ncbi:putative ATP-dependent protease [Synechococcus sp. RS9915]|nr:putative ATP-dependent protease [Synechococcus sp. RS9915]